MTTPNSNTHALPRLAAVPVSSSFLEQSLALFNSWSQRSRARDELATMDERMLNDIGITRADVTVETEKHFWQR